MSKDPAFLFYSKDFYEGTRMMLPEERACYVDLLIYQHQNGPIPFNLKRVLMYCTGVDEATLLATLETKFIKTPDGYINDKLNIVIDDRSDYIKHQSENGIVGAFWKRAYKILSKTEQKKLRSAINETTSNKKDLVDNWISKYNDPKRVLKAMLKHLAIANAIVNEDVNKDKNESFEKSEKLLNPETDIHGNPIFHLDILKNELNSSEVWKENIVRNMSEAVKGFSIQHLDGYLEQFFKQLENDDDREKSLKDAKKHFSRWLNLEIKKENNANRNGRKPRTDAELKRDASVAVDQLLGQQ